MMTVTLRGIENDSLDAIASKMSTLREKIRSTDMDSAMYEVALRQTLDEVKHLHLGVLSRIVGARVGKGRLIKPTRKDLKAYRAIPPEGKITAEDLRQGSVTVSNIGSVMKGLPVEMELLDIVPPQVAAIGIGSMREGPSGEKTIPLVLCLDHRALDGGGAKPFFDALEAVFKDPGVIRDW